MVVDSVLEGVSSPVRSRNGLSSFLPFPPWARRPEFMFRVGQPSGSHSGCREADRGSGTRFGGKGCRKADPDHGHGADGRWKAEPG